MSGGDGVARVTVAVCGTAAGAAFAIATPFGAWRAGLALATGLVIGSFNGLLVERSVRSAAGFRIASLGRLGLLSLLGLGAGLVIGSQFAVLTLLGIATAQIVLTVVAGWGLLRA